MVAERFSRICLTFCPTNAPLDNTCELGLGLSKALFAFSDRRDDVLRALTLVTAHGEVFPTQQDPPGAASGLCAAKLTGSWPPSLTAISARQNQTPDRQACCRWLAWKKKGVASENQPAYSCALVAISFKVVVGISERWFGQISNALPFPVTNKEVPFTMMYGSCFESDTSPLPVKLRTSLPV